MTPEQQAAIREIMAQAMKKRVTEPLKNIPTLSDVLAGSLGDAWKYIADAAIAELEAAGYVIIVKTLH